ncbi:MAG: DUF1049 domain-containing protein [Pseudomonadota bacterium]
MLRFIKYIVLFVIAVALIVVAMANRGPMTLRLLPEGLMSAERAEALGLAMTLTMPGFLMVLCIFFTGLLFGFIWEWLREAKHRSTAKVERRERERLEKEVNKVAPPAKTGDDVLAILDGR